MENVETNRIENKEQLTDDFEKEVTAFLNYREGGIIYIGINGAGKAVGIKDIDLTQLQIKDRIKNNIQPSTLGLFDIVVEKTDNVDVIKVVIASGTEKPYYLRKKGMTPEGCYIRVGSSKEQMTDKMIKDLFAKRARNSLKELEAPRQELTFSQLKIYYEEHHINLGDNFLRNLDLLTVDGKYNYNAFLLADENTVPIPVVKYVGADKMEILENEDYGNRCLITATQRILDKLETENRTFTKIEYHGRKHQTMLDNEAVKEAVINAIVHNDYSYGGSPIVEIYSDRLEITSSGGLPIELSEKDFLNGVVYRRNKELIKIFKDVDLIENVGSGVLRILKSYDKTCFKFMDNYLRVSFKYRENPFEYEKETTQETTQENFVTLNETQQNIIKSIKNNPSITQKEIAKQLNITRDGVKYNMDILRKLNIIKREGSTKNGFWKILS